MSRRFYWPWQLTAHPSVVVDALLELRSQDIHLDLTVTKPTIFDVVFFTTLKLIGYDRAPTLGLNTYQHVWDGSIHASVVLACTVRRGTMNSFTCCSGSDGKFSTTFILDLDTTHEIVCSKELIESWVALIVQRVLLHLPMPRPRRGCLVLCGEDFGSQSAKAFFRYDLMILQAQGNKLQNNDLLIATELKEIKEKSGGDGMYAFMTPSTSTSSPHELIEYVIVENESKEVIMNTIELFFGMGYTSPMCIFNGHGVAETGELVVRAGKHVRQIKKSDAYETISFVEISRCINKLYDNYSIASGGLAESLFVLNSCYSHLFQGVQTDAQSVLSATENGTNFAGATAPAHSRRLQIIPLTTEAIPTAPAGGCIKYLRRNPALLPAQYHDLFGGLITSDAALPSMKMYTSQFSRSMCAFGASLHGHTEATGVKSGVYVFRCGQDGAGLVRVIYDHHVRHAIIVDGGTDAKMFYQNVWKDFLLLYASTYDVVLASSDGRCASGVYALFNSKSFMKENITSTARSLPRCMRLFTKYSPPKSETTPEISYRSDLEIIISRALAAGVEVEYGVSKGTVVYSQRHRSLHAQYGVHIEAIAPAAKKSTSSSVGSAPTSVPCSPLRRDVGPRVKEQLGMSAEMSELDISLISSLVSMYTMSVDTPLPSSPMCSRTAVHPAAVHDGAPMHISVRAWTKLFQVNEPGILQCTIKRSKKKNLPVQVDGNENSPWVEFLQFPSDNV